MKKKRFSIGNNQENVFIPLRDGRRLAARVWLPEGAASQPVPAILEYLPYRKRDGTARRDDSTYPVFANAGYAGVRVDIAGTGESEGEFDDEYSERELNDGVEVINWIAAQDWCSGSVGMMGISWGGFNSLQIAALQPRPLKAVIAIGTTVDRYNDDIHYKNGCLLGSNFSWSTTMLCFASRPPDPMIAGRSWRKIWRNRLKTQPFPLETWLAHQRRDDYWKHGSVKEDFGRIKIPSLVISGWADGYTNAPPAMVAGCRSCSRAINGPWGHLYPHFAVPGPRMDFHAEAMQWWDRWLKDIDNNAEKLPAYRAYISQGVVAGGDRVCEPGRWVAESEWPSKNIRLHHLYPSSNHRLQQSAPPENDISICSPQDCGTACGEFFPLKADGEMSGDQRLDDAGSLVFETDILARSIDILGRPVVKLELSVDKPLANLAVRLVDVDGNDRAHRVSWGVQNLAHRKGNQEPVKMRPGRAERIEVSLDHCGYRFLKGHRIRLAVSTAYWPMVMPPPEAVTATVTLGESSYLSLPVRQGNDSIQIAEPINPSPLPQYHYHLSPEARREVVRDLQSGMTQYRTMEDTGEVEIPQHGMRMRHIHQQCFQILADDPLSAAVTGTYTCTMRRDDWQIRTVSEATLRCDHENFYLQASVVAWEGDKVINRRQWEKVIKRDHM